MRYHGLDLNLLVVLDKLLSERSVSRAAAELNMSQPALSNALARLRAHFDDELLTRIGRRMVVTTFAESLREGVRATLETAQQVATTRATFDAASAERTFVIVISDQAFLALAAPAIRRLASAAPGVVLKAVLTSDERDDLLRRGLVDFIVAPQAGLVADHPSTALFSDETVTLAWRDSAVPDVLSLDDYCSLGHVETTIRTGVGVVDARLAELGRSRRIAAYAPTFLLIAESLVGTDYIGTMGSRTAAVLETRLPLRRVVAPIPLGGLTLSLQWHRSREGDPGLAWMREFIVAAARDGDGSQH